MASSKADGALALVTSDWSSGSHVAAGLALGALLLTTTIARFVYRANAPLWLDEVWTGMIASERSFSGFVRQCHLDVNAPLGYLLAWLWEPVGGLSNPGLRLPSAVFASLAPLLALLPCRSVPLATRAIWAALLACWLPGFIFATEARCYALVLCLGVANAILFAELIRYPRPGPAIAWAAMSSLLILAHYFAAPLIASQGVAYLIVWRARGLRNWPALAVFAPVAAEMAWHASVLRRFAQGAHAATAQAPALRLQDVPDAVQFALGGAPIIWILLFCLLVGLLMARLRGEAVSVGKLISVGRDRGACTAAATSVACIILCLTLYQLCLVVGWARPMLVVRYFTPAVPGVLLGVALVLARVATLWSAAPLVVVSAQAAIAFFMMFSGSPKAQPISFQHAAEALLRAEASRVEFLYDDRGAGGGRDREAFSKIGGFFFHRAGRSIESDAVFLSPGQDPNEVLAARAQDEGSAILWLYNTEVAGTAALQFPPRITRIDPRWRCRDFGTGASHALACVKDRTL
ncbi:MAG: hypothetical protein JO111_10300 [Caulobacteraceae bacterium]|nr:hypothetical protein [Caulobacteraceae bacterium]